MTTLENARIKLNAIDHKMTGLFEKMMVSKNTQNAEQKTIKKQLEQLKQKRMIIIKEVALYKYRHGLPIYDPQREQELIKRNCELLTDKTYLNDYLVFINDILNESKAFQKQIITSLHPDEQ